MLESQNNRFGCERRRPSTLVEGVKLAGNQPGNAGGSGRQAGIPA